MRKLTVLVDMDGIVTDLLQKWLEAINTKYNRNATVEDVTDWDVAKNEKLSDLSRKVYAIIQKPMFFWDLEPLDGSINALQALVREGHDVMFLTAPASPNSAMEKMLWVAKHFPFIDHKNVILCHHKHLVKGDVFIDDKASGVEAYQEAHPDALVMTIKYPYNKHLEHHPKILTVGHYSDTDLAWGNALHEIRALANKPVNVLESKNELHLQDDGSTTTGRLPNCS